MYVFFSREFYHAFVCDLARRPKHHHHHHHHHHDHYSTTLKALTLKKVAVS